MRINSLEDDDNNTPPGVILFIYSNMSCYNRKLTV